MTQIMQSCCLPGGSAPTGLCCVDVGASTVPMHHDRARATPTPCPPCTPTPFQHKIPLPPQIPIRPFLFPYFPHRSPNPTAEHRMHRQLYRTVANKPGQFVSSSTAGVERALRSKVKELHTILPWGQLAGPRSLLQQVSFHCSEHSMRHAMNASPSAAVIWLVWPCAYVRYTLKILNSIQPNGASLCLCQRPLLQRALEGPAHLSSSSQLSWPKTHSEHRCSRG